MWSLPLHSYSTFSTLTRNRLCPITHNLYTRPSMHPPLPARCRGTQYSYAPAALPHRLLWSDICRLQRFLCPSHQKYVISMPVLHRVRLNNVDVGVACLLCGGLLLCGAWALCCVVGSLLCGGLFAVWWAAYWCVTRWRPLKCILHYKFITISINSRR